MQQETPNLDHYEDPELDLDVDFNTKFDELELQALSDELDEAMANGGFGKAAQK
jgi:hypothetical protein